MMPPWDNCDPQLHRPTVLRLRAWSRFFGAAVAALGALVACAWMLPIASVRDAMQGGMKVNSALAFATVGLGLVVSGQASRRKRRVAAGLGALTLLISGLTLGGHAVGLDIGVNELVVASGADPVKGASGRMSPLVALGFALLGAGLMLLQRPARVARWGMALGLMTTVLALLPVAGYVFEAPSLYGIASRSAIPLQTAVALLLLAVGVVLARPELGMMATVCASGAFGSLARRVIPAAVAVPLLVAAVLVAPVWLDASIELSLYAVANSVILTAITWWIMRLGARAESELRHHHEEVLRSERRLATTLAGIGDAVVATDARGMVTAMNPAAEAMIGTPFELARGTPFGSLVRLDGEAGEDDLATQVLRERVCLLSGDYRQLRTPEGPRPVTFSASPVGSSQHAAEGTVIVLHDVAERMRTQEMLITSSRLVALGTLSAGVAHEINNPLAVIMLTLDMMRRRLARVDEPSRAAILPMIDEVGEASVRIQNIVRDMKVFARGDDPGPPHAIDVHAVIDSIVRVMANELRHQARLALDLRPVPRAVGGESQLAQVLVNLLTNAAQAIPDGHADRHEIRLVTELVAGERVAISVSDTGTGMAPAVLERLFTPFFTTKPVGSGTGLGLAISRGLVERMGGLIEVESVEGRGSTFRVLLPVATEVDAAAPASPTARYRPRRRVLVIDDEASLARALATAISSVHDVVVATSGQAGLDRLTAGERFDVVVCDVMMPVTAGAELFARAVAQRPELAGRFVFVTGDAFTADARAFVASLANPCLTKPFQVEELLEAIDLVAS